MLDLAPEIENTVLEYAAYEGVSVNELMARTFPRRQPQSAQAWAPPLPDHSADAQRAAIHALLALPKEEIARLNAPSTAMLRAQLEEAAKATPEEIARADAEWEEHKRRMNAHRAVTGERPLFADVSPAGA